MNKSLLKEDSAHAYLKILQGIMVRLAGNSANCKTWATGIVSAIIVLSFDKGHNKGYLIALPPTLTFFVLDAYYRSLERDVKDIYNKFVSHPSEDMLFVVTLPKSFWRRITGTLRGLISISVFPCYLMIIITLFTCYYYLAA